MAAVMKISFLQIAVLKSRFREGGFSSGYFAVHSTRQEDSRMGQHPSSTGPATAASTATNVSAAQSDSGIIHKVISRTNARYIERSLLFYVS